MQHALTAARTAPVRHGLLTVTHGVLWLEVDEVSASLLIEINDWLGNELAELAEAKGDDATEVELRHGLGLWLARNGNLDASEMFDRDAHRAHDRGSR